MSIYEVPALSRYDLRCFANQIRKEFHINSLCFPVLKFLEFIMTNRGFDYRLLTEEDFNQKFGRDKHACYKLQDKTIYIRESVYLRAEQGEGRDRFTIMHEISHALLLKESDIKLFRARGRRLQVLSYCDPEWQASCLAGELLMPYKSCKDMTAMQIMYDCKVSGEAAFYQISHAYKGR